MRFPCLMNAKGSDPERNHGGSGARSVFINPNSDPDTDPTWNLCIVYRAGQSGVNFRKEGFNSKPGSGI